METDINHNVTVTHETKGAFPASGDQTGPRHLPARSVPQALPTGISALTEVTAHAAGEGVSTVGLHHGHLLVGKQLRSAQENRSPFIE